MTSLPFSSIGASSFLRDMAAGRPETLRLFHTPHNRRTFAEQRSSQGASRRRLAELCRQAVGTLPLSALQESRLVALGTATSVIAITGQQVGFLGGPLYTLLKIASTVAAARELSQSLGLDVVPMFWLEDNDHDAAEAGAATLPDVAGVAVNVRLWDGGPERRAVHRRVISADDTHRVEHAANLLHGSFANAAAERVRHAYSAGTSWSDAMMAMLHPYLAEWGVLAVRGSHVVASGLHAPIIQHEAAHPGAMASLVAEQDSHLTTLGYKPQATVGEYSFFVEVDGVRHRPIAEDGMVRVGAELWTADQLQAWVAAHPEWCSPGVLLRPLLQDALLPTIVNIVGGAEAAYHAQIASCYDAHGVTRPMTWLRHSATIVDQRTQRLMEKASLDILDVLRPWADVERELVSDMAADIIPDVSQRPFLDEWKTAAEGIDPTLRAAVGAAEAAIGKALEQLAGKMRTALKRKHSEMVDRRRVIAGVLYPTDTLQERVIPLAWFEARLGYETFRKIADAVVTAERTMHHVVLVGDLTHPETNNIETPHGT